MPRRLLACLALLPLAFGALGTPPDASAAWGTSGATTVTGQAMKLSGTAAAAPTVTAVGLWPAVRTFTLTWSTAWLHEGRPATGYLVSRNASLSSAPMDSGTCRGAVANGVSAVYVPATPGAVTQSCTDTTLLNLGTVRYTVTPVYGRWIGTTAAWSNALA